MYNLTYKMIASLKNLDFTCANSGRAKERKLLQISDRQICKFEIA